MDDRAHATVPGPYAADYLICVPRNRILGASVVSDLAPELALANRRAGAE